MIKQASTKVVLPPQSNKASPAISRSHSAPRTSPSSIPSTNKVVNPIATLSHKDKLLLSEALKKTPSKQGITPLIKFNPQDYLFDLDDDETNIIVDDGNVIKAATIEKLVERVTTELYADVTFVYEFLLTYRQFTTPTSLMDLLFRRFYMPEPAELTGEELEAFRRQKLIPVRLRVFNLVKLWVKDHWVDFKDNTELVALVRKFISILTSSGMLSSADQLDKLLSKMLEGEDGAKKIDFYQQPPKPCPLLVKKGKQQGEMSILHIHPLEVARQLTIIEHALFRRIKPWEFLSQRFSSSDKATKAPGIMAMIHRFNNVSKWVASTIITAKDKKERVLVLDRFIEIAERCKNLNNFNAMTAIMAGLQSSSIYRLKHLWPELPSKQLDLFEEMVEMISSRSSFKNFRDYIHRCQPPCVPYLGVYLTDLTFIEDGTQDIVHGNLINFAKCRMISKTIMEIKTYQQAPYCLEGVPTLQTFFETLAFLDDDECYKRSLLIEGRSSGGSSDSQNPLPYSRTRTPSSSTQVTNQTNVKIRLPGAKVPVTLPLNKHATIGAMLQNLCTQYDLNSDGDLMLVIAPTNKSSGEVLDKDKSLKDVKIDPHTVLEVWGSPTIFKVATSVRGSLSAFQDVIITFSMPLVRMIPTFQKMFNLMSAEEFCFLYTEPEKDGYARFLRMNRSPKEERCSPTHGRLLIYPVVNFFNTAASQLKDATKSGYLIKQSRKRALSYNRVTPKKKRWFVLKDYFLFYYKNKTDTSPAGVITLEYFTVKIEQIDDNGTQYMILKRNFDEFSTPVIAFILTVPEGTKESLAEWHGTISKRVLNCKAEMEGAVLCIPLDPSTSLPKLADAARKWLLLETNNSFLTICSTKLSEGHEAMIPLEEATISIPSEALVQKFSDRTGAGPSSSFLRHHNNLAATAFILRGGGAGAGVVMVVDSEGEREQWFRVFQVHAVPIVDELDERVFGRDLDDTTHNGSTELPKFVDSAVQYVKACGLNTPGIFCVEADTDEVIRSRKAVDDGKDIFLANTSVHLVTSLLKLYFQLLPNSVLTMYRYDRFVRAAQEEDLNARVHGIKLVTDTLPSAHKNLAVAMVTMWHEMCLLRGSPATSSSDFLQAWAPIMLRSKYAIPKEKQEKEHTLVCLVLADMIRHHSVIFGVARYNSAEEIQVHRFVNCPTLTPKKLVKQLQASPMVKPPPMPVSKSPAKVARIIRQRKNEFEEKAKAMAMEETAPTSSSSANTTPSPSPSPSSSTFPNNNNSNNNDKSAPGDKIIVHYTNYTNGTTQKQHDRLVVNNVKGRVVLLDHIRQACSCPKGCLVDENDCNRVLMAGDTPVRPGVYQLYIPVSRIPSPSRHSLPSSSPIFAPVHSGDSPPPPWSHDEVGKF